MKVVEYSMKVAFNSVKVGNCYMSDSNANYFVPNLFQLRLQKLDEMGFACTASAIYHTTSSYNKLFCHFFLKCVLWTSTNTFRLWRVIPKQIIFMNHVIPT